MKSSFALDAKERVREAVDIVELVGGYIPLRRQGHNYVGLCPWHDDSRPSLQVNPDRQSFKCWVCDVGGDVFSFVMRIENLDFREAMEMLAERAGIALQAPRSSASTAQSLSDKRTLYRAMAWAQQQYHRLLLEADEAQLARDYLRERKINEQSIRQFQLGFAPNQWDWLLKLAQRSQANQAVLERVGLLIRRETGEGFYDRFRGRLMFPIRDARGRTIAFGGRVLPQLADEHSGGKYINSPETPLFAKSREFYGLDLAREAIAKEGTAIVMEGYTDCLMAHQHGVQNVIAVLGTALGERHLPVLRRFTDSITLVLDGDDAGRRRANEILELFVAHEVELRILTLPEGCDPCDLIASQGGDAFRRLVAQAVDALEHKLNLESNGLDVHTETHRATQAAERVLATLARAHIGAGVASSTMQLREQQMLTRTAHRFRLPVKDLHARLVDLRRKSRHRPLTSLTAETDKRTTHLEPTPVPVREWHFNERELFELVFLDAQMLGSIQGEVEPSAIKTPTARSLFEQCLSLWREGETALYDRLMLECEDAATKSILLRLDEDSRAKSSSDKAQRLNDLLQSYRRQAAPAMVPPNCDHQSADQALASFLNAVRPAHLNEYRKRKP